VMSLDHLHVLKSVSLRWVSGYEIRLSNKLTMTSSGLTCIPLASHEAYYTSCRFHTESLVFPTRYKFQESPARQCKCEIVDMA
jgi:hypothetical protein